jgi:hypothetical protein
MVTGTVRTYRTYTVIRYHHALAAIFNIIPETIDCRCEVMYILGRLLQKMKSQTKGTSTSHPGKGAYSIYSITEKFRRVIIFI